VVPQERRYRDLGLGAGASEQPLAVALLLPCLPLLLRL
jgi:hypothetical protein